MTWPEWHLLRGKWLLRFERLWTLHKAAEYTLIIRK